MKNSINIQKIIDGCLLGDGCLEMHKKAKNACFTYRSASEQHTRFVHNFFKEFCSENYQEIKRGETFDRRTNKTYVSFYFKTRCLPVFTEQYRRFYKQGVKIVPRDITADKETLLLWYIGDGELESSYGYIKLHSNSFSIDEVDFLCDKLKEFNAKSLRKKENEFLVTIPRNKVKKFLKFIGDCPFEDYSHKWNFVEYKNKNIELNGFSFYADLYPLIVKDFKKHKGTIYELHKKYNVPIKAIKHHFDKNNVCWTPVKMNKEILQLDLDNNFIKEWKSGQEVKRELGYNASAISECCRGIRKKYKNYIWKFKI